MLQDMGVAACGNLVSVPLEARGRVSYLDGNPFNQWCATEATVSFFKKCKKEFQRPQNSSVFFSSLGSYFSWDILDWREHHLPNLMGNVAINYQLRIIPRTEFLCASLRVSFD